MLVLHILYFVVGGGAMSNLSRGASLRLQKAFRPKTHRSYYFMFRIFMAFCVFMAISMSKVNVKCILSFLEWLVRQNVSVHMLCNYIAAIKANFIMYYLRYTLLADPKIKYFIKSV